MSVVEGFGGNSGEIKDQKVIPDKLTAYRMFRFRPRAENTTPQHDWGRYVEAGGDGFSPCLTAASYPNTRYDRPGVYKAQCQRRQGLQSFQLIATAKELERIGEFQHAAPDGNCACGFWAYYTPDVLDTGNGNDWMALAAVKVQGNVVLGDKGVRAEAMEIVGLQIPSELLNAHEAVISAWLDLCEQLKVPHFWAKSELLKFFPPQDVSELIPKPEPAPQFPYDLSQLDSYSYYQLMRQNGWRMPPSWLYHAGPPQPQTPAVTYTNRTNPFHNFAMLKGAAYVPPEYIEATCQVCQYKMISVSQEVADETMATHWMEHHISSSSP